MCVSGLCGCSHGPRPGDELDVPAGTQAEIYRFVQTYLEAATKSDLNVLMSMVLNSPSATSVANGELTVGWDAIEKQVEESNRTPLALRVWLTGAPRQFQLAPDAMLVVAPYTLRVANAARSVDLHAVTTLVLVKREGEWRVLHEHN